MFLSLSRPLGEGKSVHQGLGLLRDLRGHVRVWLGIIYLPPNLRSHFATRLSIPWGHGGGGGVNK